MRSVRRSLGVVLAMAIPAFASTSFALDICGETVPANRFIDGIPAYAQCAGSMTAAIYSDDGINTATTSAGTAWVRTQGSGGYQCTELAHRYLRFRFNVASVPNGNAGVWCDATLPAGLQKTPTPTHGDLIVLAPGSCGADATTGHVAVIDTVAADAASVMAVQQNGASRSRYNTTCAACFLHAAANTGAPATDGGSVDAGVADSAVPGSGGRAGSGGAAGTGGIAASGGRSAMDRDASSPPSTGGATTPAATGGAPTSTGSGGASVGTGGAIGSGGAPSVDAGSGLVDAGSSGCACNVPGVPTGPVPFGLSLSAAVALLILARRHRP